MRQGIAVICYDKCNIDRLAGVCLCYHLSYFFEIISGCYMVFLGIEDVGFSCFSAFSRGERCNVV